MNLKKTAIAAAIALGVIGATAYAHGYGPGMMGGYGGYGMGPGMMGGYGGHGMGAGMMGGYGGDGMGPGMMGGPGGFRAYGMGPGMMGGANFAALDSLDLSDQQHKQVLAIRDTLYKDNQQVMAKLHDEMEKLHDASSASGQSDWDALLAANKRVTSLRQQMFENSVAAARKTEALLTPAQRQQYARLGRACHFDDDD